jgi:hypothetical protein
MLLALLSHKTMDLQPPWRSIAQITIMHCMPQEQIGIHKEV